MKSPARQETQEVRAPPSSRPTLPPAPATALYQATARVRAGPSAKLTVSRASVDGAAIAAPTPCRARAPSSQAGDWAMPPSIEAKVKRAMPAAKTWRRPRMSPARAPSSSRPPKVSV